MKTKKILSLLLIATSSISITACAKSIGNKSTVPTQPKNAQNVTASINKNDSQEIKNLKAELNKANNIITELKKTPQAKDNSAIAFVGRANGLLYFPIYRGLGGQSKEVSSYIAIAPQAKVDEKLTILLKAIGDNLFNENTIKLVRIDTVAGKKIATINLVNAQEWQNYLQGTTGGSSTFVSLSESILQKTFKNSWIDGVKFTLDGKSFTQENAEMLNKTIYRRK